MSDRDDERIRSVYPALEPRLRELDARRIGIRNTIIAGVVTLAIGFGSCVTIFDAPPSLQQQPLWRFAPLVLSLVTVLCIGIAIAKMLVPGVTAHMEYRARFKKDVVAALAKALLPGARYMADRHLGKPDYDASRLFRFQLDKFGGDDMLQGFVGDTPFECSELRASYSTGSGDDKKYHDVFKGLFARIDFDRDIAGHVLLQAPDTEETGDRSGMDRVEIDRGSTRPTRSGPRGPRRPASC